MSHREDNKIAISVIIPAYRAERTIGECLDSVLTQSLSDIEVIVVDDGSDDSTPQLLSDYASGDPRITLLAQQNQYAGVARNRGMEIARGKYVAFLDADDILLPNILATMHEQAERHNLDLLKTGFIYHDTTTGEKYTTLYSKTSSVSLLRKRTIFNFKQLPERLLNVPDVPWNGLYRRDFLERNNIRFNDLRCSNDHSFFIHCLLCARRIMVSSRSIVCYRVAQSESLIGKKAYHFDCQTASYNIVRELCRDADPKLSKLIMQQELNGVFGWYQRLRPMSENPEKLDEQLKKFITELDENDVGKEFFEQFSYSPDYYKIRYNTAAPKRPNALTRAIRCHKEHGLAYTIERLIGKGERRFRV